MKTTLTKTSMILSATALLTVVTLSSCSKESDLDTIKDAQMCLNTATQTTAQSCVSKLSAMTTNQANQLKCAAYFIEEGFGTPSALLNAVDAAKGTSCSGCSPSMNIITQLSFSSASNASAAFDVCNSSGIAVYSQLSSLVQISTMVSSVSTTATTADEFKTVISGLSDSALGSIVETTYASSCSGQSGSGEALQDYCGELGEALAGNSASAVGACLKYKLVGGAPPGNGCPP